MRPAAFALFVPLMMSAPTSAANYTARKTVVDGVDIVQLADAARHADVSIATSIGNMAYEFNVAGKNFLWFPYHSPEEMRENPRFCCVPFLAPWANRLDQDAFWANGRKYLLNPGLGNLRRDQHQKPIHGLLNFSPDWKVSAVDADADSAWTTSRLEFWKFPELMAQFPFAHTISMTYRLRNGELQVETVIDNLSGEPMPVAIGFHPYFQLHDAPRDQWKVHLAAREHMLLNNLVIPTGETKPVEFADPYPLHGSQLDDVFTNLVRGPNGLARFWVEGVKERVTVTYGPKYTVAVVYAPASGSFLCFEPMSAITDAFNLAHDGVYKELQSIPPGGQWKESFSIAVTGI
ncbi:MAG TPA: aldose 1-epimerase [Bryobacteraceae bacterium]|nr:aldose 1-epimerase [Bryobacteraceae bacterium]